MNDIFRRIAADYQHLKLTWDDSSTAPWADISYAERPCFTIGLLNDLIRLQADLAFGRIPTNRIVVSSSWPGIFGLGGDLSTFVQLIRSGNLAQLEHYGRMAVDAVHGGAMLYPRHGIETIVCIEGDALGGGFEAALSFTTIVAEKNARFGFPEIGFGFFPGMGAINLVARRAGITAARQLVFDPRLRTAEEMAELGIVDILCEPGSGRETCRRYAADAAPAGEQPRFSLPAPDHEEMTSVVLDWAKTGFELRDTDLRMMERLVAAQDRLLEARVA